VPHICLAFHATPSFSFFEKYITLILFFLFLFFLSVCLFCFGGYKFLGKNEFEFKHSLAVNQRKWCMQTDNQNPSQCCGVHYHKHRPGWQFNLEVATVVFERFQCLFNREDNCRLHNEFLQIFEAQTISGQTEVMWMICAHSHIHSKIFKDPALHIVSVTSSLASKLGSWLTNMLLLQYCCIEIVLLKEHKCWTIGLMI